MCRFSKLVLTMSCLAVLASCGDDAPHEGRSSDASTAGDSSTSTSGRGGSGGGASGRGAAGMTGVIGAPVKCGAATCEAPPGVMGLIMPCCADETSGTCGMTSLMGGACTKPSSGDPRCPSVQAMGTFTIPSCCTAEGQCGIDASMFGFGGCTDLASAAMMSMSSGSGTVLPPPRACDDVDAGTEDAGS